MEKHANVTLAPWVSTSSQDQAPVPYEDNAESVKMAARIRHRIDWRLIPWLGIMYSISLLDRKNVSNAAIAGMLADLDLTTGSGYNVVNMSFFITYVLMQPAMLLLCRRIGPHLFLPAITAAMGFAVMGVGFAPSWQVMVPLRLLLGAFEAGSPGAIYLLSCWYTRYEVSRRFSLMYMFSSFGAGCSGLIAYGLQQMEGMHGIRGWRWIFIMEGVLSCVVALISYVFLVQFPDQEATKPSRRFLSADELKFQVARLNHDRGDVDPGEFSWRLLLQPARQWYTYGFCFTLFLTLTVAYGFSFTMPIILRNKLGFSLALSQCLTAPPYMLAAVSSYVSAVWSDRHQSRGPYICGSALVSLAGTAIVGFVQDARVQYAGVFVCVSGAYAMLPLIMAYQANNVRGQWMRVFSTACMTAFGGIGGVSGAFIFRVQDGPRFVPGFASCIACNVLIIFTVGALTLYFRRKNGQADRGECVILGDPRFRFTI